MYTFLLAIIYISFIGLGLPDSLLGSAWPLMSTDFSVSISYAGVISMIISGCTIVSSLFSDKFTRKLGTGLVTTVSVLLTAVALFGFSLSKTFITACVFSIPYGLGAGAVDAALNNYAALHYKSRHMSWLHCFWGIGATIGPYVMSAAIEAEQGWRTGYRTVSYIQIVLTFILILVLPIWNKEKLNYSNNNISESDMGIGNALKISGVKFILIAFFGYCAFESTAGLWASTYLVNYKNVDAETSAIFASLFYMGITVGRFLSGFICNKIGDKNMIRIGIGIIFFGILFLAIPFTNICFSLAGLVIIGLGAAPIYPSIIHATPEHFGKENSHAIVGIQMASAYIGSTIAPPIFGMIAGKSKIVLYPYYMLTFLIILLLMTEAVNRKTTGGTADIE